MVDLLEFPSVRQTINIEGVEVTALGLAQVLRSAFDPDPKRWFRYQKTLIDGEPQILCEYKVDDES